MSYLFISHDLNVVRLLCDRILVMYLGKLVETGPTDAIFNHPSHPYTQALISAIPSFDISSNGSRAEAPGLSESEAPALSGAEVQSPINPSPHICRLYGRCPKGDKQCQQILPDLRPISDHHQVACHYPDLP